MHFRFRLQPVLSYRESREETLETELARLQEALYKEQQLMLRLQAKEAEALDLFEQWQRADIRLDPTTLDLHHAYLDWLAARIAQQAAAVAVAQHRVEGKRQELVRAMQDKKALEKLKEHDYRRLLLSEKRSETKRTDEMSIVRFHRRLVGLG